jgi:anthranilate synthase component 2
MLLMIDNYDSFTYNLVQYFGELGAEVRVVRNDEITLEGIAALAPYHLVLSPGPCSPAEAGICVEAIRHFTGKLPILGVCLGHQAIGAALGGRVVHAQVQMHARAPHPTYALRSVA